MIKLLESRNYPREGYFWIIDNEVVGISEEVPNYNYEFLLDGKTHENTWRLFKSDYKVNGKEVGFDYFPRGRVVTDPNYDKNNKFTNYSVTVLLDNCIDTDDCKCLIADYYNLNLATCPNILWMSLKKRTGIGHYTCHNCRGRK